MPDRRSTKTPEEYAEIRARAWATRRERYGSGGHKGLDKGAYSRGQRLAEPAAPAPASALVIGPLVASSAPIVTLAWTDAAGRHEEARAAIVIGDRYTFAGTVPFAFAPEADVRVNGRPASSVIGWLNPARFEVST